MSLVFGLIAVFFVGFGIYNCRSNSYSYMLDCRKDECSYSVKDGMANRYSKIFFPKSDLLDAEAIRIDSSGNYIDISKIPIAEAKNAGHSIRLKLRLPPEPDSKLKVEKQQVFIPYDIGRRTSRSGVKSITAYILDHTKSDFRFYKGRNVTLVGILSGFFGFLALLVVILFGRWQDSTPKRMKKAN
jgi:hypothetical protein